MSRITARKAIELLVEQGLIRRARGAGSFITPRVEDPLSRLTGFTKKMQQRGFRPDSVWLERDIRAANRDELVHLGLSPGAAVASLRRLRRADGIVMAVEHSALPAAIVPRPAGDRRLAVQLSGTARHGGGARACSTFARSTRRARSLR